MYGKHNLFLLLILTVIFSSCLNTCGNTQIPSASLKFPPNKDTIEIPFTRYRGWIVVKVSVNGSKDLAFILDTGAPIAILANPDTSNRLHLNITGNAMVSGTDINKPKSVPLATSVKFKIGDIIISNGLLAVGAASEAINGADGIIGKYLFDDAVVTIDWNRNKLILIKPGTFSYSGKGEIIPITLLPSGHIYSNISLEKNGKKLYLKSDIDLGNRSNFYVNKEKESLVTNEKMIRNIIVSWGANGAAFGDITRTDINIGSSRLDNVITAFSDQPEKDSLNANLGLSILERFIPTFDYTHRQLILEKNDNYTAPFIFNKSGIILNPKRQDDYVLIADIIFSSSAQQAGLQIGDRITSINEKQVSSLSQDIIDSLIQGKTSDIIQIAILRNGKEMEFKLKTKEIL